MSSLPKGLYIIRSAIDRRIGMDYDYLEPLLPQIAVQGAGDEIHRKWRISPSGDPGSNLYTIIPDDPDRYNLVVKDKLLWISNIASPTQFSIEAAGEGTSRFHIPNEDSVLRLDKEFTQIKVAAQDGTKNELWFVEEWHPVSEQETSAE